MKWVDINWAWFVHDVLHELLVTLQLMTVWTVTTQITAYISIAQLCTGKIACPPKWHAFFVDVMSKSELTTICFFILKNQNPTSFSLSSFSIVHCNFKWQISFRPFLKKSMTGAARLLAFESLTWNPMDPPSESLTSTNWNILICWHSTSWQHPSKSRLNRCLLNCKCNGDLKSDHLQSGNIWRPDFLKITFQMVQFSKGLGYSYA